MKSSRNFLSILTSIGLTLGSVILATPSQAVTLITDENDFLASSPIVSTETFDSLLGNRFPGPSVTLDLVTYSDDAASSWEVEETNFNIISLFSIDSVEPTTISFGDSRFVEAIGFNLIPWGFATGQPFYEFQFQVEEHGGELTTFSSRPTPGRKNYFGFNSEAGIRMITVFQPLGQGGRTNWSYDDVSRSVVESIPMTIDIKPGNNRNVINPGAKGGIWVAILSDTDPASPFDPSSQVNIPTVEFGSDGAKAVRDKVKDINNDGLGDLLLRFAVLETGIACGDTEATLTGETFDGQSFTGTDLINTVGCEADKPKKDKDDKKHK